MDKKQFPASDLARHPADVLDAASRRPVAITKHKKPRFMLMSVEHYERLLKAGNPQHAYKTSELPPDLRDELLAGIDTELAED